jgi:predicted tellurium resistance membrane protein TerC
MGAGIWFWVIIGTGTTVALSAFIPMLSSLGAALAGLLSVVSTGAVILGLIANTIGSSSHQDSNQVLLFVLFACIAITGFILMAINNRKSVPPNA